MEVKAWPVREAEKVGQRRPRRYDKSPAGLHGVLREIHGLHWTAGGVDRARGEAAQNEGAAHGNPYRAPLLWFAPPEAKRPSVVSLKCLVFRKRERQLAMQPRLSRYHSKSNTHHHFLRRSRANRPRPPSRAAEGSGMARSWSMLICTEEFASRLIVWFASFAVKVPIAHWPTPEPLL